ncbi:hypothetical protein MMC12_002706 [Toensbergia leucococca]|nr:hypothetical protein [Toensbergia leucococca]
MRWANTVRDSPRSPHSIYNPPVASPRTSQPNTTRHDAVARIQEQLLRLGPRSPILQSAAVLESPARTPEQVLRSAQKIPVVQSAAVVESPARTQEQLLRSAQINPRDFGTVREKLSCQNHPDNLANISAGGEMATTHGSNLLDATSATVIIHKAEVIQIAKDQEKVIHEKLRRNGDEIPKYEFLEIIGKGAYGRVFKCHDQVHNRVVALKVIDVDATDYNINAEAKDDSIAATVHEIKVLQQLRDSRAKNVNLIFDAFQMHSQLWIVNDYCPGGSVHTLMRATGNKLEEKYILPIARELAIGLKAIHEAGIIHRDIKGNIINTVTIHDERKKRLW